MEVWLLKALSDNKLYVVRKVKEIKATHGKCISTFDLIIVQGSVQVCRLLHNIIS